MNGRGESPTFAMFCTMDDAGTVILFAKVHDEIGAVQAFHDHVAHYGEDHVPHIHMEPMREEWYGDVIIENAGLDPARNLFRPPAEAAS
jgi:hypothetical protein